MEPLKEMFNRAYYKNLAQVFASVYKPFQAERFVKAVTANLEELSLNERMRNTSVVLHNHLPNDFATSIAIMKEVIPQLKGGYTNLVFPDYVAQFGQTDFSLSLDALKCFTRFGSSEFAIRTFLKHDLNTTLKEMYKWANDENEHVRRLASEGSRPRLPWSFKLDAIIEKPSLTTPILQTLRADDALYVRKSVANHLNDITKDSPEHVLNLIKSWDRAHPHTAWIIKRGCRSLLKQGDQKSMAIFNLTKKVEITIKNFTLNKSTLRLNDTLLFQFSIVSNKKINQRLMVDYRIHYSKKSGVQLPKVFKLKELDLKPGETIAIKKQQRFQDFTTRKLHSGTHLLEIVVNGNVVAKKKFEFKR
ncbi:MAG: DNA alkylation repair protein [Cyclobacteriaceae bacterium]|nr:DNA alkylation repair protein [Cyclobacteriaceae bacterium]